MSVRVVLLCAGATAGARAGRFPDPAEPLDAGGRAKAAALGLPGLRGMAWCSPDAAARETAAVLGVDAGVEPALRDMAAGEWAGRGLEAIDPLALAGWLAAPEAGAPGGETLAAVQARVAAWLDALAPGHHLAVTHAAVVRGAIAHALGVPVAATLGIDVAPLSATTLSHAGRWRVQELRRA